MFSRIYKVSTYDLSDLAASIVLTIRDRTILQANTQSGVNNTQHNARTSHVLTIDYMVVTVHCACVQILGTGEHKVSWGGGGGLSSGY